MKTVAAARVVPLRASKAPRKQKKVRRFTDLDIRRQKTLKAYWNLHKSLGMDLSLARVGRRKGLNDGAMAGHCLHGHAALNEIWMLCFAYELKATPQQIWGNDWPFPDLTPGDHGVMRPYHSLSPNAQAEIRKIIEADKRR